MKIEQQYVLADSCKGLIVLNLHDVAVFSQKQDIAL